MVPGPRCWGWWGAADLDIPHPDLSQGLLRRGRGSARAGAGPLRGARSAGSASRRQAAARRPVRGECEMEGVGWEFHGESAQIDGLEIVSTGPTQGPDGPLNGGAYTATPYPGPKKHRVFIATSCWWADGLSAPPGCVAPRDLAEAAGAGPAPAAHHPQRPRQDAAPVRVAIRSDISKRNCFYGIANSPRPFS